MSGPVLHWDIEQNSAVWLAARMAIPTASAFDRIITPEGKRSAQSTVYMAKLLWEWLSGYPIQEDEDPYESDFMRTGHEYEERTVATFEFVTGYKAEKIGGISNWDGMLWASPDRVIRASSDSLLACAEVKSPAPWTQLMYWFDKEEKPAVVSDKKEELLLIKKYRPQLQGQLLVAETDKQFACSDHPKCKPVLLEVGRDEPYIKTASQYLREFVDKILERRLILEREFGKRKPAQQQPADGLNEFGVTMEDVEAIIAAKNK
jgi:hypothetical protein